MSSLATFHVQQMERLSSDFFEDCDGLRAVARRTDTVDDIVSSRFREEFGGEGGGIAAIAVGGYGRCELFPHSDIDLLLLFSKAKEAEQRREKIATLLTTLWDSKLRVSHSVRDPRECAKLAPNNAELHISLLDTRFIAGDKDFFKEFCTVTLPRFYLREQRALIRALSEGARRRHRAFEQTLYHLEPNIKEGPGGLRDYHLACWMAQLENLQTNRIPWSEEFLPAQRGWDIDGAKQFLFAVRCFLHYYYGRDKNLLSYDMQDAIAHAGSARVYSGEGGAADLMRTYYRNTRSMYRLALRLMEDAAAPSNALLKILRRRRSRLSNADFSVSQGKVFFQHPHAVGSRPELVMRIFEFVARHGIPLAAQTEARIQDHLAEIGEHFLAGPSQWPKLRTVLLLPHVYKALEAMRETGVLYTLLPELELVDCLVIRNFYHRFTVDEHTLMAIRILKELPDATESIDRRFAGLLAEVSDADLLYLALLFHDVGKGIPGESHGEASGKLAGVAMQRIGVGGAADRETVVQLIRHHTLMSEVMTKRDLSETAVLEQFKARVATVERLRLLTLLTYADSSAVDPSSNSSWRKELLWRLFLGVYGIFQRDHEDRRIQPGVRAACLDMVDSDAERQKMGGFLQGFPERYLRTHTPQQVHDHFRLAAGLVGDEAAAVFTETHGDFEILVIGRERPFLFASLCAAIASYGFSIVQAEAFSNDAGLVLDSFRVTAGPQTPVSNVDGSAVNGFEQRLRRVAEGSLDASALLRKRGALWYRRRRHAEPPHVSFDNATSARATIFYVQAADRARLLYDLASVFSQHACDIDLVLCETQGHRVADVFYIRQEERKLSEDLCGILKAELLAACDQDSFV